MTPCMVRLAISAAHSSSSRYSERKGSASKSGPDGPSRRSTGKRSRSVGTLEPSPASGPSQPSSSPTFDRIAQSVRAAREEPCDGSPAAIPCTTRGKSPGPPGVGSAHTSSSRKSRVSSWIRHGREVCAVFGSLIRAPPSIRGTAMYHTYVHVRVSSRSKGQGPAARQRSTQAERSARTRSALLESAARSLSRYGYGNLVLEQVAREAGYTRGALYHQFKDKEDLALAVVEWVDETWRREVGGLVDQQPDPVAALVALARGHAVYCRRNVARVEMALSLEFNGQEHPVGREVERISETL